MPRRWMLRLCCAPTESTRGRTHHRHVVAVGPGLDRAATGRTTIFQPLLDQTVTHAYRQRLSTLDREIGEYRSANDHARA